jgi:hypothetical protein
MMQTVNVKFLDVTSVTGLSGCSVEWDMYSRDGSPDQLESTVIMMLILI